MSGSSRICRRLGPGKLCAAWSLAYRTLWTLVIFPPWPTRRLWRYYGSRCKPRRWHTGRFRESYQRRNWRRLKGLGRQNRRRLERRSEPSAGVSRVASSGTRTTGRTTCWQQASSTSYSHGGGRARSPSAGQDHKVGLHRWLMDSADNLVDARPVRREAELRQVAAGDRARQVVALDAQLVLSPVHADDLQRDAVALIGHHGAGRPAIRLDLPPAIGVRWLECVATAARQRRGREGLLLYGRVPLGIHRRHVDDTFHRRLGSRCPRSAPGDR